MNGVRRRWAAIAGLVALAAAGAWLMRGGPGDGEAATVEVRRGRLEQAIETAGVVQPADPVTIAGGVSGQIETLAVRAGDRVEAGDIAAQIEPPPFEAAVRAATRARDAAELALTLAEAGRAMATPTTAESIGARLAVDDARAALAAAERDREATAILIPAAGTVLSVAVVEGQGYAAGAPAAVVNAGDRLNVVADLDEVDVPRVPNGTGVTLVVDAFPGVELAGRVVRVAPQGEARGGGTVFPTTVEVADFRGVAARPGMTVSVRVPAVVAEDALLVPSAAIETVGERSFVRVARGDGTARVEVTTGLRAGGLVEVTSGELGEGDRVRIEG